MAGTTALESSLASSTMGAHNEKVPPVNQQTEPHQAGTKSASILNLDQASRTEKSISVVQVMAFEYSGLDGPKHFLTLTIIPSQQQATKKLYRPAALAFLQYN